MKSDDCHYGWHEDDETGTGCSGRNEEGRRCTCRCHRTED